MIPPQLDLTPEGEQLAKRLVRVKTHGRKDSQLQSALDKSLNRFAEAWRRGLEKGDAWGRSAVAVLDRQLAGDAPTAELSVEDAALLASVVGAYESSDLFLVAELLWRARGGFSATSFSSELKWAAAI